MVDLIQLNHARDPIVILGVMDIRRHYWTVRSLIVLHQAA